MSKKLEGKRALITGGGTGIGKAITKKFFEEGAEVMIVGRREHVLEVSAREIDETLEKVWFAKADIRKSEECEKVFELAKSRWGRVDILVNNAGISDNNVRFVDTPLRIYDDIMNTNLKGAFVMSQLAAHSMKSSNGGVILHNASIDGIRAEIGFVVYNCSKAALISLTRTMATELGAHGIRVNSVSPGYTLTDLTRQDAGPKLTRVLQTSFKRTPIGRAAMPEEIAKVFAFLASDEASYITGQNIVVDGGLTANLYVVETFDQGTYGK